MMMQAAKIDTCLQARVKFHVLLTSNEMVKKEMGDLKRLEWECLIVDEGHRLKQKGELFTHLTSLSTQHRVLLTGQQITMSFCCTSTWILFILWW